MIIKAKITDVKEIHLLINDFAKKGVVLARSLNYIYDNIRDFWVYKKENKVVACVALHVVGWDGLAEIKSLVVEKSYQKQGIGAELINICLKEAKTLAVKKVFALTFVDTFFIKLGFKSINKKTLPHKIWADCLNCSFFPNCKEAAFIKEI
jgi:amino-acid N-acetyltransferase